MNDNDFDVGIKFKYMGMNFPNEYDRTQIVTHMITINGLKGVRAKFLDNEYTHIFEINNKRGSYSKECVKIDDSYKNGIPIFWDEMIFDD